jgi:tetratricopeptide (TPR) repeat protein
LAKVLAWQGAFFYSLGRFETAREALEKSLDLLDRSEFADVDTRSEKAFALLRLGFVFDTDTSLDSEQAPTLYRRSRALYDELGDQHGLALALVALGRSAARRGAYGEAGQLLKEGQALRQALGDKRGIAFSLDWLGIVASHLGQFEESERLLREGIAISREIGCMEYLAASLINLGMTMNLRGQSTDAVSVLEEAVAISEEVALRFIPISVYALAWTELHLGQYEEARVRALRHLNALREHSDDQPGFYLRSLAAAALAMEDYAQARQLMKELVTTSRQFAGHHLQPHTFFDALILLGYAERGLGQLSQVRAHLGEALHIAGQTRFFWSNIHAQTAFALVLADEGEAERAVELYALASSSPFVSNSRWFEDVAGKHIAAAAATLPPDVVSAAQQRGRARDLWETAKELLAELEGKADDA